METAAAVITTSSSLEQHIATQGLGKARKIDHSRVGAEPGDDGLGTLASGNVSNRVQIDQSGRFIHVVRYGPEEAAARVDGRPVGQVSAMRKLEAHQGISRVHDREI